MRLPSVALVLVLSAAPALAIDVVELKSGKILEVEESSVRNGRLHVRLHTKANQKIAYTIPIAQVVPEFVFYAWAGGLKAGDTAGHRKLAEWSRQNGLFSHALKLYETIAGFDEATKEALPALKTTLREEEATWHFRMAEALFKAGQIKGARTSIEVVLDHFKDSKEIGRASALLNIIKEREQFLGEEKLKAGIAKRAKTHKRVLDRQLAEIGRADGMAGKAHLRYVQDARWRLRHASHIYNRAAVVLSDLLPFVEVDELRRMIEAHLDNLGSRITRTLVRLADLRYLVGDMGGALDAIHQILDVEPDNKAAVTLRDRILDGPGPVHVRYRRGFLSHRRRLHYPYPYYGFYRFRRWGAGGWGGRRWGGGISIRQDHPYPYAQEVYTYR